MGFLRGTVLICYVVGWIGSVVGGLGEVGEEGEFWARLVVLGRGLVGGFTYVALVSLGSGVRRRVRWELEDITPHGRVWLAMAIYVNWRNICSGRGKPLEAAGLGRYCTRKARHEGYLSIQASTIPINSSQKHSYC